MIETRDIAADVVPICLAKALKMAIGWMEV